MTIHLIKIQVPQTIRHAKAYRLLQVKNLSLRELTTLL